MAHVMGQRRKGGEGVWVKRDLATREWKRLFYPKLMGGGLCGS